MCLLFVSILMMDNNKRSDHKWYCYSNNLFLHHHYLSSINSDYQKFLPPGCYDITSLYHNLGELGSMPPMQYVNYVWCADYTTHTHNLSCYMHTVNLVLKYDVALAWSPCNLGYGMNCWLPWQLMIDSQVCWRQKIEDAEWCHEMGLGAYNRFILTSKWYLRIKM